VFSARIFSENKDVEFIFSFSSDNDDEEKNKENRDEK
jgi:hypothetical protein